MLGPSDRDPTEVQNEPPPGPPPETADLEAYMARLIDEQEGEPEEE